MPIAPHQVDQVRYRMPPATHQRTLFPVLSAPHRKRQLQLPTHPLHIVLDTDTKNEIDDQFALVYALLSPEIVVEAIHAAPFVKPPYLTPAAGMEASYREILALFRH